MPPEGGVAPPSQAISRAVSRCPSAGALNAGRHHADPVRVWTALGKPRWTWIAGWMLAGGAAVMGVRALDLESGAFLDAPSVAAVGLFLAAVFRLASYGLRSAWHGNAAAIGFFFGAGATLILLSAVEVSHHRLCHGTNFVGAVTYSCGDAHERQRRIVGIIFIALATATYVRAIHRIRTRRPTTDGSPGSVG